MNRARILIASLSIALIGSNALWAYRVLDLGVTATYYQVSFDDRRTALKQTLALLPVVARPNTTRESVILAAQVGPDSSAPFEKDGYVWVDRIGLKFDDNNRLVEVVPAWSPF